jgi:RHS repeat-associated protein
MKNGIGLTLLVGSTFVISISAGPIDRVQVTEPSSRGKGRHVEHLAGQSSTLLPNGNVLLLGGMRNDVPVTDAITWDPHAKTSMPLASGLSEARAWHTATLLPNGKVLVLGGVRRDGRLADSVELLDLESQKFKTLQATQWTPRALHSATLLTDGSVLIAGGVSKSGDNLRVLERWDTQMSVALPLPVELHFPRRSHEANLLPSGNVLLWGGFDDEGTPREDGEVFDVDIQQLTVVKEKPQENPGQTPKVVGSTPEDGAQDVPVDGFFALRFSRPLKPETVNRRTVVLTDIAEKHVAISVVPAEGGMLAFVTPVEPLSAFTSYTLTLKGSNDTSGRTIPTTQLNFVTGDRVMSGGALAAQLSDGNDKVDSVSDSRWQNLPPLQAAPGVTALAGQVLKVNGEPLANVTLKIDDLAVVSDRTGRFVLAPLNPGRKVLTIDGRTANNQGRAYGVFLPLVDVAQGYTNVLPFTIWMPALDTQHATQFPVPTTQEIVATTPRIPGLEVHIPAGVVFRDINGQLQSSISITQIPMGRMPMPGPQGMVESPLLFTLQPGGTVVEGADGGIGPGLRIIMPNAAGWDPGYRVRLWGFDPSKSGWYVFGEGTVSPDGKRIVPDDSAVIRRLSCVEAGNPPGAPPATAPAPGNGATGGEPVDLGTGLFVYQKSDLLLPDTIPIALTRTYRPGDTSTPPRAFGIGMTHPYNMFLYDETNGRSLILPDGSRIFYPSGGPTPNLHTSTPTKFYGSTLAIGVTDGTKSLATVTLKDGTVYGFLGLDVNPLTSNYFHYFLDSIRDHNGNSLTITRNENNDQDIKKIESPNGRSIEFTYDASHRITQAKDNIGRTATYTYDTSGRLSTVTDAGGGVTTYNYDTSHRMTKITDPRGITYITNAYDGNGRVTKQTLADKTTYQFSYTLDGNGKVTQTNVTDPRGIIRRVTFNSSGYTLTDTYAQGNPEQQTITYQRDATSNLVTSVTDPLNRQTAYTYDSMGNVTSITRLAGTPNAVTTSMTYEPTFNQLASVTDPLNHTTNFGYDSTGNLISVLDALQHQWSFGYNQSGQVTSATDPLTHSTQFTYDGGDLASITDPLGRSITRFVDGGGRLASVTDPLGNQTRYTYDNLNQLAQITDPLNGNTSFTYDGNGNLLTVTDARGSVMTYTYNNMDRLTSRKDPLLKSESYTYDANGNLTQFTDRRGKVTVFTYDNLNRRTFTGFGKTGGGNPNYESTINYTLDAGNRLTQAVDSLAGTITLGYDNLDRLTSETTPQGSITYGYDNAGRRTSMTVAGQTAVTYTFDDANRLTQIAQGSSTVGFTYDNTNRRATLTLPNGIVAMYSFDNASSLTGISYTLGANPVGDLTYAYDLAGRRTNMSGSMARTGFPLAVSSATYNAGNRLTNWGGTSLTYDLNGNLTGDGANSYTWNARNQLITIAAGSTTIGSFQYDAFGRRKSKTVAGTATNFLYSGANIVQELSGSTPTGNLLTGGVDEIFTRTDSTGARNFLTDALGSTLALSDSTGTVQTQYTYEPFGATNVTGQANGNSFRYTGREDDGTGLYFYRARYYSSRFQRFASEDPIGFGGGSANLYAYVHNSPLTLRDPSGKFSPFWHAYITLMAAMGAGWDFGRALALANAVVHVDFLEHTQDVEAPYANWHAMSGILPGRKDRKWQTCDEAYSNSEDIFLQDINSQSFEGIAKALHMIQDAYSPAHFGFQRWEGGLPSPDHIRDDSILSPSSAPILSATSASGGLLFNLDSGSPGAISPSDYFPQNPCGPRTF